MTFDEIQELVTSSDWKTKRREAEAEHLRLFPFYPEMDADEYAEHIAQAWLSGMHFATNTIIKEASPCCQSSN